MLTVSTTRTGLSRIACASLNWALNDSVAFLVHSQPPYITPHALSRNSVPMTVTTNEPMMPRLFEKKRNTGHLRYDNRRRQQLFRFEHHCHRLAEALIITPAPPWKRFMILLQGQVRVSRTRGNGVCRSYDK